MNIMNTRLPSPTTSRGQAVFFIWKILPRLVLLVMILLIAMLTFVVIKKKESIALENKNAIAKERAPVNVVAYPLVPTQIRDKMNLPGSIEPWTRLILMAKVGGTITEVRVKEGDEVKKGDIIAQIEANDYQIALQRAQAAYKLAKSNYERDRRVYAKGVIPTAELDARETAMMTAKADLENAQLQLSRCTITAPINGVIRSLDAKVGLLLSVADPIAEILEIDRVKGVVGIPESDIIAVRKLDNIDLSIKALDNKVITAQKHFLSPSPDSAARLYRLELELDNQNRDILPGMFIRAEIVKQTVENGIAIPFYSVISRKDEHYVYIEENGVAKKRRVELGIMENWLVHVTEGLAASENLIVEGHRDIEDNQKVNVVKTITSFDNY